MSEIDDVAFPATVPKKFYPGQTWRCVKSNGGKWIEGLTYTVSAVSSDRSACRFAEGSDYIYDIDSPRGYEFVFVAER